MLYLDGEEVKVGDIVTLGEDCPGMVVCSIDTRAYAQAYTEADWSYLRTGILVEFDALGLVLYEAISPDLRLVARAA